MGPESDFSSIPTSIYDKLPLMVKTELGKMPALKQGMFVEEYRRKQKSVGMAYLLWLLFGLYYLYLGKTGWQFALWLTFMGLLVWWFIDLFRIPGMVRSYNMDVATDVLRDLKIISAS